ncbi:SAGA histone acetylase and TREX-2 complexes component [Tulasnella sp. 330]|nr:SAGA histone acetylase and TREX-2 complexes component [Tulasnella sp. 330]KAG8870018.1 SAGA histone acetylase and TREX-2 complexes component [Tulasnella sp. 332]
MPSRAPSKPKSTGETAKASAPSAAAVSPEELEALKQTLIKRLIDTGEWNRSSFIVLFQTLMIWVEKSLSAILKDRLHESGWMDDVSNQAKEYARQQDPLHFKTLIQELTPKAEATVPDDVKEEITALLRTWIDENTEM